ncbi:hypothetical protein LJC56_05615 [Christensenellaceae bacterium OttesenSCG-928-K19]|nr:hypothetical protein [Christensenellaceae bacterium OttesenSCG-928-K19]
MIKKYIALSLCMSLFFAGCTSKDVSSVSEAASAESTVACVAEADESQPVITTKEPVAEYDETKMEATASPGPRPAPTASPSASAAADVQGKPAASADAPNPHMPLNGGKERKPSCRKNIIVSIFA